MSPSPSSPSAVDPYALTRDELVDLLAALGQPRYRADQVLEWLVRGVDDAEQMTNLPKELRAKLGELFGPSRPQLLKHSVSDQGRTHKILLQLPDGEAVETVLMLYPGRGDQQGRATVCISTQAGCAMGCPFCATGQAGFRRQLTTGEVVRQVVVCDAALRSGSLGDQDLPSGSPDHVTNVVYMGMGEPLANLDATIGSIRWLHDPEGFDLGARGITVSTVGLVPGMRRLAEEGLPMTLAVSLHAGNDELRDDLVPVNRMHPIGEVIAAIKDYERATNRRVSLEWCLIGDVNDSLDDADELADIAHASHTHINVIPMNPTPGVNWKEPTRARLKAFVARLEERGCNVTVRDTRGRGADAACGQLLAQYHLGAGKRLPVAVGAAERIQANLDGAAS